MVGVCLRSASPPSSAGTAQFGVQVLLGRLAQSRHGEFVAESTAVNPERPRDRSHRFGRRTEPYRPTGKLEPAAIYRALLHLGDTGRVREDELDGPHRAYSPVAGL